MRLTKLNVSGNKRSREALANILVRSLGRLSSPMKSASTSPRFFRTLVTLNFH
jgi:hypothetical protein